jgi:spore germination protein YaaH
LFKRLRIFFLAIILFVLLLSPYSSFASTTPSGRFIDVPVGNWADKLIHEARNINLTQGIGKNLFGYGLTVTRAEFVKFLVSLMDWNLVNPQKGSFIDNQNSKKWYYSYIETALQEGAITNAESRFRPEDNITREEMAVMIVRSLGYDGLARQLQFMEKPFYDVKDNTGYITIVKDFGIVTGKGNNIFDPYGTAKREEAVAMLMRLHSKLNQPLDELHAFYAINSNPQRDMINRLTSVSFGWSRLQYEPSEKRVILNTTTKNGNEFYIPDGFSERVKQAKQKNISTQLMVFASQENRVIDEENNINMGLVEYILSTPEIRRQVISDIVKAVNSLEKENEKAAFDGVVIDFECMKGAELAYRLNSFLAELKKELGNKKLYVAVHPKRMSEFDYYDGYDYRLIGEIADKIILMAHDYGAATLSERDMESGYNDTPLAPINEVYYALKAITDKSSGVSDLKKVWLQISFDSLQWQKKDGKIINRDAFRPNYESIRNRLLKDCAINYHDIFKYPWATYYNDTEGVHNIIWYEDSRSVLDKINLARMFGINGISLWRLGNIPAFEETGEKEIYLDVWQKILELSKP